jgi:hypothetical protein
MLPQTYSIQVSVSPSWKGRMQDNRYANATNAMCLVNEYVYSWPFSTI